MQGGEVIELGGDLGAGKTTLAQSIIRKLGFNGDIPSPTFTVGRIYNVRDRLEVHHFDFYRLQGHDVVTQQLKEIMQNPKAIVLIEWPNEGGAELPDGRLQISLEAGESETERVISIRGSQVYKDLFKDLANVFST